MQHGHRQGVLSQTLASSPCIKTVLSARIRSPLLNDVVFVGHSSIHLREFSQAGQLSNVLANLELGAQILAAKVISAEKHVLSTEDAIFENGKDEIRYKIRGEPCDDSQPPQIVVLSSSTGEFIFVYARNSPTGAVHFVHARRQILAARQWPLKYGKHLAIDSQSRALAVASAKGSFGVFALKHVDHIKDDIDAWDPRTPESMQPFNEQRFVPVDGVVLRMDFLRSPAGEPDRVVLLLIVANHGTARLLLYKWDLWRPLTTIKALKCSGQPLPPEDSFPHLLIPSCRWASFAIVTGPKIVFYDDLSSRAMKRSSVDLRVERGKQWVQYAKPVRHQEHKKRKEDIFLVREDGHLESIVVTHSSESRTSIALSPGHLGIHVDTAVCALSAPPTMGGDILIACGDTTEGGVFHLAALQAPLLLQTLSNWSPINDVVHVDDKYPGSALHDHGSILATTGIHADRAFLTELRHGTEAQIAETMQHEEVSSIDRIWALERPGERRLLLLASHHEHTSLLCYDIDNDQFIIEDSSTYPQLSFQYPTLTIRTISCGALIQITSHNVNILPPATGSCTNEPCCVGDFICADVDPGYGIFVVAERTAGDVRLIGGIVTAVGHTRLEVSSLPSTHTMAYVPVDLKVFPLASKTACLAASQDDLIQLYELDPHHGFLPITSWQLQSFSPILDQVKFSSICILAMENTASLLVVCGTKTGQLALLELSTSDISNTGLPTLRLLKCQTIGNTAVQVNTSSAVSPADEISAYVICASSISRIRLHQNNHGLDCEIDSLLITNRADPFYSPPTVCAIDRIGQLSLSAETTDLSGRLVCAAGEEILLLEVGQTTTTARPIKLIPHSQHLVHSRHLRKCIVGVQGRNSSSSISGERPYLHLIDPNTFVDNQGGLPKSRFYFGEKGEKIRALLYWQPTDGESHYDMLVIGTELGGDGRLAYMGTTRMMPAKPAGTAKFFAKFSKKSISAICPYGKSSLVVCAGRELKLVHLDMKTKKFRILVDYELPSHAVELQTKGSTIYVATSSHSFMLIREENGKLRQMGGDSWAGKARNVIPYGRCSTLVNLVSDHGSRILSFAERPTAVTRPTFEAMVPQAIDKIVALKISSTENERERFLATTIDGTVYMFSILTEPEMKLLDFLQRLCEPIRDQKARETSALAQSIADRFARRLETAGITPPTPGSTHARGDMLNGLICPGPYYIYYLLKRRAHLQDPDSMVKQEDEVETLEELARPVISGKKDDVVERVILWLRRLLNVPSF